MLKKFFELIRFKFHRAILKDDYLIDIPEPTDLDDMIFRGLEYMPFDDDLPLENEPFTPTEDMIWCPKASQLFSPEELEVLLTFVDEDEEVII